MSVEDVPAPISKTFYLKISCQFSCCGSESCARKFAGIRTWSLYSEAFLYAFEWVIRLGQVSFHLWRPGMSGTLEA